MRRSKKFLIVFFDGDGFDFRKTDDERGISFCLRGLKRRKKEVLGFKVFTILSEGELEINNYEMPKRR